MSRAETIASSPDVSKILLTERKPRILEELAEQLGVGVDIISATIDTLKKDGYGVTRTGDLFVRSMTPTNGEATNLSHRFDKKHLHFGIVSDTHMSSKHERLDALHAMYDRFKEEGVTTVFHAGDITDGVGVYRGHENEIKHHNQTDQIQHVIDNYPRHEGIKTYHITGNHDLRAYEKGGADPGVVIAKSRRDIDYLGQMSATVILPGKTKLELLHPAGGGSYALSYKAQRDINNRSVDDIPDILVYGHYHTSFFMHYRNLNFLQAPSFKDAGQFEKRLGLHSTIGGWIVDATVGDKGITSFKPELFTYNNKQKK